MDSYDLFKKMYADIQDLKVRVGILERTHDISESVPQVQDELFDDARYVVVLAKKASATLLQRRLRIGYARAVYLLNILERQGVIGPADGARPRDVLITAEDLDNL